MTFCPVALPLSYVHRMHGWIRTNDLQVLLICSHTGIRGIRNVVTDYLQAVCQRWSELTNHH